MPSFNPQTDFPNLTNRVALITRATSGLGRAVVLSLLKNDAKVYLAACNETKAIATISQLKREDLSPGYGKTLWNKLTLKNPGIWSIIPQFSFMEIQDIIIVNHISLILFTNTLLILVKKWALLPDSDVWIVPSDIHRLAYDVKFKEKDDFNGPTFNDNFKDRFTRYGYTKLLNISGHSGLLEGSNN